MNPRGRQDIIRAYELAALLLGFFALFFFTPLRGASPLFEALPGSSPAEAGNWALVEPGDDRDEASSTTGALTRLPRLGALLIEQTGDSSSGAALAAGEPARLVVLRSIEAGAARPGPYQPLRHAKKEWYGSTFWTGPDWTRVGKDWHHPGHDTPSVRRFVAPIGGRFKVTGRARKLHLKGDGVRLSIKHGDKEIWRAEIDGDDGNGIDPNLALTLKKGDALRFIVHKRGTIACDTTHWDPLITGPKGTSHRASDAFGAKQGRGGWFYEMLGDAKAPTGKTPTLYGVRRDGSIIEQTAAARAPVVIDGENALPLVVLEAADRQSGLALLPAAGDGWRVVFTGGALTLETKHAPSRALLAGHRGSWTGALSMLNAAPANGGPAARLIRDCRTAIDNAYQNLTEGLDQTPAWDLFLMAQSDWRRDDRIQETIESYATAAREHLARAAALAAQITKQREGQPPNPAFSTRARLQTAMTGPALTLADWRRLYLRTRLFKRIIALRNPLLDFGPLLVCKRKPPTWSHLVAQYFGWRQQPGGGLFEVLEPGYSLETRDIVGDQLPEGNFLEPCLSWDAKRIVFSFVEAPAQTPDPQALPVNEAGGAEHYFHIWEINVDGTGLQRLTRGKYDDMMPCYLPDGGIAFCSTRRRSYARCFGPPYSRRWHSYTVHRIDTGGGNLRMLSPNDVSEWFPTVANSGHLLFARWDYIDRDAVTHQNLWAMRPDGTNPVAVWGNATPKPHCTFQARPIPGSQKIAFIAAAHHAITGGPLCLLDPAVDSNSSLDAVTRITPQPFPEAEGRIDSYYESPWPLSENRFLIAYSPAPLKMQGQVSRGDPNPDNALGIYLLDARGNRELIYRDPEISTTSPVPLQPRPKPPVLVSSTPKNAPGEGEFFLTDVYQGLGNDLKRGDIKSLRVVQIFPKTTWLANRPLLGVAGEENGRAILGTVPVEPDGSARFIVPALKPVYFQALDEHGFAYQTMRTVTYVQPGERVSCVGCHEDRMSVAPPSEVPMALRRPPSRLEPGEFGVEPFSYVRTVQPILDRYCVRCHGAKDPEAELNLTGQPHNGFTRSYWSLCGSPDTFRGRNIDPQLAEEALVPRFGQRNQIQTTPPGGRYGARGSRLLKLLRDGHHDVTLADSETRALATWIDLNAIFYGVFEPKAQAKQLAGQPVSMPEIQ